MQAYTISSIAKWDWPQHWPNLFDQLMHFLESGDPNLVHGTMRVLTGEQEWVWQGVWSSQLFYVRVLSECVFLQADTCGTDHPATLIEAPSSAPALQCSHKDKSSPHLQHFVWPYLHCL